MYGLTYQPQPSALVQVMVPQDQGNHALPIPNVAHLVEMIRGQLDFLLWSINKLIYWKPYTKWYDQAYELPRGYKIPKFSRFSGDDGILIVEHIGQFLDQCGEASVNYILKLRLFVNLLMGSTF